MHKYLPFIIREQLCCCLHVNYIVYKHCDKSLHIGVLDNKKQKKNWRNGLFAIFSKATI